MANLTLALDDDLLHRARIRAATDGTSVNAVVRELLTAYSAADRVEAARRRLVALSVSSAAGSGGRPVVGGGT
jgi:plasmid stability protein